MRTTFPVFGSAHSAPKAQMQTSFVEAGFFSSEIRLWRQQSEGREAIQRFIETIRRAHDDIQKTSNIKFTKQHFGAAPISLMLWLRTLEAAQGAVLLADMGMASTSPAALRTSLESLFWAAALWLDDKLVERWNFNNAEELAKFARGVLTHAAGPIAPEHLDKLNAATKPAGNQKISVLEVSKKAGLEELYHVYYRGLSGIGAHATESSLQYFNPREMNNRPTVISGPNYESASAVTTAAIDIIQAGRERFKEFLKSNGISI